MIALVSGQCSGGNTGYMKQEVTEAIAMSGEWLRADLLSASLETLQMACPPWHQGAATSGERVLSTSGTTWMYVNFCARS